MKLIKYILLLGLASQPLMHAEDNFFSTIAKWTMPALKFLTFASGVYILCDQAKQLQQLESKLLTQEKKITKNKQVIKKLKKQVQEIHPLNIQINAPDLREMTDRQVLTAELMKIKIDNLRMKNSLKAVKDGQEKFEDMVINSFEESQRKLETEITRKFTSQSKRITDVISLHYDKTFNAVDLGHINNKLNCFFKIMGKNNEIN